MRKQVKELAEQAPREFERQAAELTEQLLFLEKKLKETRRALADAPLVIEYRDTQGQKRTKANPAFDAYNSLLGSFIKALGELRSLLNIQKTEKPKGTLARFDVLAGAGKLKRDA